MTQIPLFCPKCENENPDGQEQSKTCAVCGHTYPSAVRREELSKEQLVPVLNISSTPPTSRIKAKAQRITVDRGIKWGKVLFFSVIAGALSIKAFLSVLLFIQKNSFSIFPFLIFISFLVGAFYMFYFIMKDNRRQKADKADSVISLEGDEILVFTELFRIKSETSRTLFPIEAEYIFYTLAGGNSAVRLSSQNRRGSIPLIENLQAAEARWLALYMRKYLQNHTIGA